MSRYRLEGLIPAVVTPMKENFEVDYDAFDSYIEWIVKQGIVGLAVNVDTGEGPTLNSEERVQLLEIAKDRLKNSQVLVAGLTAFSTSATINESIIAKNAGADVMLVFPNPGFRGEPQNPLALKNYFSVIAEGADIDLMLFQLQDALGGIEFYEESFRAIASLERVVAIKEASFNFSLFKRTIELFRDIEEENDRKIAFLTGNDNFIFESFLWGCDGALIGAGAQDTQRIASCFKASKKKDWMNAIELAKKIQPLVDVVFLPPVRNYRARTKACLYLQGVIPNKVVRPPLIDVREEEMNILRRALREAELEVLR